VGFTSQKVGIRAQKVGITARKIHELSTLRGRVINIRKVSFQHFKDKPKSNKKDKSKADPIIRLRRALNLDCLEAFVLAFISVLLNFSYLL
jgi:hypothetical protein